MEIRKSLHGYNNNELRYRCEPTNHKISYDGYNYRWLVKVNDCWEIQSTILYTQYKTAYSHIFFWLSKYSKEMSNRDNASVSNYFAKLELDVEAEAKLHEISREYTSKTKDKITQMISIKSDITNERISKLLDVSIRSVERHRKSLNI